MSIGRALPGSLAALACLLFVALAADGAEPRDSLDLGEKSPEVRAAAFSPDGRLLALYNAKDRTVTLWDVAKKKQTAALKSEGWIASWDFRFTEDGKSLIVAGSPVIVWDLATLKERRRIDHFDEKIADTYGHPVFTPDGKSMIMASAKWGILVFDMATGKVAKTIQSDGAPIGKVSSMAVSLDGKTLAVGTGCEYAGDLRNRRIVRWGGALFLCDLEKGEVRHKVLDAGTDGEGGQTGLYDVRLLAFSPDGTRLVSCSEGRRVMVWDPATGKNLDFLRVGFELGGLEALAFSPDGKTLAMAHVKVGLWDVNAGGFRDDFGVMPNRGGIVRRLAFSPDGKTLVTAGDDVPVQFWDVPAGAPKTVRQDTSPIYVPGPRPITLPLPPP